MASAYAYAEVEAAPGSNLFFVFHGTGGDENQFLGLARELLPAARIIAPRGDVSEHGALRYFKRKSEGVYDMQDLARATSQMIAFVGAHKTKLSPPRIIGLGYSNGANILASVIFGQPALFDTVMLMHPLIPFAPPISNHWPKVLITAGKRDPICPPPMTQALAEHLHAKLEWHDGGHELRPGEITAAKTFLNLRT